MKRVMRSIEIFSLLVFSVLMIGFAVAASSTQTEFDISGCGKIAVGGCSKNLNDAFYCDESGKLNVFSVPGACTGFDSIKGTTDDCCPAGYLCQGSLGEELCVQRTMDCASIFEQQECENQNCIWMNGNCSDPSLLSCSSYLSELSCKTDTYDLAVNGYGSEVCSSGLGSDSKVLIPGSCECIWDNSSVCYLSYNISNLIDDYDGGLNEKFQCLKQFDLSECVDGRQILTSIVMKILSIPASANYTPTQQELVEAQCVSGEQQVSCGQAIVKLPGFDYTNLIWAVLGIVLLYVVLHHNQKKTIKRGKKK